MTQSEPAEIDFAVSTEGGAVHQPDPSRSVKVPEVTRITPRIALVRRGTARRPAFAQCPGPRGVVHKKMTARVAAEIELTLAHDSGVRRQSNARTAIDCFTGPGIEKECADVILARSVETAIGQHG